MGKPFHYPELVSRIAAVMRRASGRRDQGVLQVGELRIDPLSREVMLDGARIELSAKEFALLRTLAAEPTRVFTKEQLLRDVWGFQLMGTSRRSPMSCRVHTRNQLCRRRRSQAPSQWLAEPGRHGQRGVRTCTSRALGIPTLNFLNRLRRFEDPPQEAGRAGNELDAPVVVGTAELGDVGSGVAIRLS
jgi:hypothetical protein